MDRTLMAFRPPGPLLKPLRQTWLAALHGVALGLLVGLLLCHGRTASAAQGAAGGGGGGGRGVFVTAGGLPQLVPKPFDITGFIQEATLDTAGSICKASDLRLAGGTIKVNNTQIIIPCNTILQMPASTLTWQELFSLAPRDIGLPVDGNGMPLQTGLALADKVKLPVATPYNGPLPSYEVHIQGNVIDGKYVAGLIFISQQNLNLAQGVITAIDYENGELLLATRGLHPGVARVKINDPLGRYGLSHGAPGSGASIVEPGYDLRFSIDEDSPTVHAATGFPMCIPRTDPFNTADDPDCPQANRPRSPNCASLPPPFPAFAMPANGQYCSNYMMPPPSGAACSGEGSCAPDPTRQVPFEVGDFIDYMGTLKVDSKGAYISAHTLVGHLGVYTTPGTMPVYLTIEMELQGTAALPFNNLPQETTSRIKIEGFSTDPSALVDIYAVDVDPFSGAITDRLLGAANPSGPPVIGRFRFRPFAGAFLPPTREFRVVSRTLCANPGQVCTLSGGSATYANGVVAGQYHAPNFEFIFPENIILGDAPVPANFQDMVFLFCGSGPLATPTGSGNPPKVGQLDPPPWDAPMATPNFGVALCPANRRVGAPLATLAAPAPAAAPAATPPPLPAAVPPAAPVVVPPPAASPVPPTAVAATPAAPAAVAPAVTAAQSVASQAAAAQSAPLSAASAQITAVPAASAPAAPAPLSVVASVGAPPADPATSRPADAPPPDALPANLLPPEVIALAQPDVVSSNQGVALIAAANDPNLPPRPLSYSWTQIGWPAVALTNADKESANFIAPAVTTPTELSFNVAVRNSGAQATNFSLTVLVKPQLPPPAVSIAVPAMALAGSRVVLEGSVSGKSGFVWTQTAGPALKLNNPTTLSPDFIAPPGPAKLSFVLTATNAAGTQASATRSIEVGVDQIGLRSVSWDNRQGKGRLTLVATSSVISAAAPTPPAGLTLSASFWNNSLPSSAAGSESHPLSATLLLVKDVPGQEAICASPLPCFQLVQNGAIVDPASPRERPTFLAPTSVLIKSSLGGKNAVSGTQILLR